MQRSLAFKRNLKDWFVRDNISTDAFQRSFRTLKNLRIHSIIRLMLKRMPKVVSRAVTFLQSLKFSLPQKSKFFKKCFCQKPFFVNKNIFKGRNGKFFNRSVLA